MQLKIPTDSTLSNPQDPKDAAQSHAPGDSDFMPYVPAWGRLADALERVSAGGHPIEMAQADLCRAIADRSVNIRCTLKSHATRLLTSKETLDGKDFDIPTEIKPEDLDWVSSRPLKPWNVRRGRYSIPGYWNLGVLKVSNADVAKVLCVAKERASTQKAAESPATGTSPPTIEHQDLVDSGRRSTAQLRKHSAGPARRRGVKPEKLERTKSAMRDDIQQRRLTMAEFENMIEKNLETKYGVSRDTARKARQAVLSELNSRHIPTNDK